VAAVVVEVEVVTNVVVETDVVVGIDVDVVVFGAKTCGVT